MKDGGGSWYYRRAAPIFCEPCLPFYEVVYPAKLIILVVSFILWVGGVLILIGTFIACVAAICEAPVYSSLIPLALMFMMVGYCLFHCAWAAYLLDEPETNVYVNREPEEVIVESEPSDRLIAHDGVGATGEDQPLGPDVPMDPMKYGHWKFVPDRPWQNKCSRDNLQ